jgi:ech hydrogenase subunit C
VSFSQEIPWVIHYDASSCNGCDIEVLACLMPHFDVERLGIVNTGNPKHADVFLVTGSVNAQNAAVVRNIYAQMPDPKVVVAVGICGCSGGIFADCYNVQGGVDAVIPVDVYVPGCAARPRRSSMASCAPSSAGNEAPVPAGRRRRQRVLINANLKDVPEILALQKIAIERSRTLGDDSVPALHQTRSRSPPTSARCFPQAWPTADHRFRARPPGRRRGPRRPRDRPSVFGAAASPPADRQMEREWATRAGSRPSPATKHAELHLYESSVPAGPDRAVFPTSNGCICRRSAHDRKRNIFPSRRKRWCAAQKMRAKPFAWSRSASPAGRNSN